MTPAAKHPTRKPRARKPATPATVSISVTIDAELHRRLVARAQADERSLLGTIRYALRRHVDGPETLELEEAGR